MTFLAGGVDKGLCPSISSLRPGSVAQRCDGLCAGDRVTAVNGISTSHLKHDEIVSLLRGVEDRAVLELEYPLPPFRKSYLPRIKTCSAEKHDLQCEFLSVKYNAHHLKFSISYRFRICSHD